MGFCVSSIRPHGCLLGLSYTRYERKLYIRNKWWAHQYKFNYIYSKLGDIELINIEWPITPLNVSYQILAKTLALWIKYILLEYYQEYETRHSYKPNLTLISKTMKNNTLYQPYKMIKHCMETQHALRKVITHFILLFWNLPWGTRLELSNMWEEINIMNMHPLRTRKQDTIK